MTTKEQRFVEHVRNGWAWYPEVLEALLKGDTTPKDQAKSYHDVDETEGLSVDDAIKVIEYALLNPKY